VQELAVVRQVFDVERDGLRNECLESRLSSKKFSRQSQRKHGMLAQEHQQRIDERV